MVKELLSGQDRHFNCLGTDNEIVLFLVDRLRGTVECNDGAVKGQRNNYTSLFIITDGSLSGSNIECICENGTNSSVIGNLSIPTIEAHSGRYCTVAVTAIHVIITNVNYAEPLSTPINFQLVHVYTNQLVFKWNKSVHCSSLRYKINATGYDNYPDHTCIMNNNVTCADVPTNSTGGSLCMFSVKDVVCESNKSSFNGIINVTLHGR